MTTIYNARRLFAAALIAALVTGTVGIFALNIADASQTEKEDVFIVFKHLPGPAEKAVVNSFGGKVKYSYHLVPAIATSLPKAAVEALARHPLVDVIEPDGLVYAVDAELDNTWGVKRVNAGTVHDSGTKGTGVKVAVIDSGVDYTHPDLAANYAGGYDFVNNDSDPMDDNGHGTHVAGTVAAVKDAAGVVGAAPEAKVYALKVLNANGSGSWSDIVAALQWAVDNGIQITNNSYGSSFSPGVAVETAFANAEAAGVLHVAAAGNSGNCSGKGDSVGYPARYASVIAVAATDKNDARACFSSTGSSTELSAPGVAINSTKLGGGYVEFNGTSMASPHVAGVAALVLAFGISDANGNGRLNDEVRGTLTGTATDLGEAGRDKFYGFGLVNAAAAVGFVPEPVPVPAQVTVDSVSYKNTKRWLSVTVALKDDLGNPVSGASVSIKLNHDSGKSWTGSGNTNSYGKVTFSLRSAPDGCYSTDVTNVSASGLAWNGATPANNFCK